MFSSQPPEIQSVFFKHKLTGDNIRQLVEGRLLFAHQGGAVNAVAEHFEGHERFGVVVLPTGSGKTGVGVLTCYRMGCKRVLFVSPDKDLRDQAHDDFCGVKNRQDAFVCKRGIWDGDVNTYLPEVDGTCVKSAKHLLDVLAPGGRFSPKTELVVANVHKFGTTSNARLPNVNPDDETGEVEIDYFARDSFDLVIVDEAHHIPAQTWMTILDYFQEAKVLFLTATPSDGLLDRFRTSLVWESTRAEMVEAGVIRD